MKFLINIFHFLINIIYIIWLSNIIQKNELISFYLITFMVCMGSVFLHEISHMVYAKIKRYNVIYVRILGLKANFLEQKIRFELSSILLLGGQTNIDYASRIVDEETKNETLKDVKNNFIVGAIITIIIFVIGTIICILNITNVIAVCVSWINGNILIASCKKDSSIQDLYGYFNFDTLQEEIIFIIFFQAVSSDKLSRYLYDRIASNLVIKLDNGMRLSKQDLNALILIMSYKNKFDNRSILSRLLKNYAHIEYDNLVLYYLLLCMIVTNNWNQYDLKEIYLFILQQKDFVSVAKIPIIGYRYVFYNMLFILGESRYNYSKWRYWDEFRLGICI